MLEQQPHSLTAAEREAYRNDGFFVRRGVFPAAEVARLSTAVEAANRAALAAAAEPGGGATYHLDGNRFVDTAACTVQFEHQPGSDTVRVIEPIHVLHPALDTLLDHPLLVRPMQGLVGQSRLALWTAKLNLKRPREGSGFGWHQDSPYWMHNCRHVDRLPNVMLALDEQSADNGCFEVIRGSHKQGILPGTSDGSQLGGFFTDPACFDLSQRVRLTGPPGSLFFFSPHSVHGSRPNRSSRPRRALIMTYQPGGQPMLKIPAVRNIN